MDDLSSSYVVRGIPVDEAATFAADTSFLERGHLPGFEASFALERQVSSMSTDAELHRFILDNLAEGICLVRAADLAIVYANPRFEQLFGYGPGELISRPVAILNYAADDAQAAAVAHGISAELERHREATYEIQNRKKDGAPFWCRARTSAFDHPEHGVVWVAIHTDITAEKAVEGRLRHNQQLLQTVVDSLPVGLWITDRDGRIIRGNPAGQRIWEGARYVGVEQYGAYRGWWAATGEPIAAEDWALARAVRKGETSVGELIRIQCFDGSFKLILNSATPLRDGDEITGAVVVNEDVTRLVEAEALSAGVIAAAPDAIVATDGDQRIVVFNAGAERMFGHARDEVVGHELGILVASDHREALVALVAASVAGSVVEMRPLTCCRRSGEPFPAEVSAAWTKGGLTDRATLVFRDITTRVQAEAERAELARALDHERTWLRALVATAPMGLIAFEATGKMLHNRRAEELLGIELANAGREAYVGICHRPDGTPLSMAELPSVRAAHDERVAAEEYLLVRPDGTRRWVLGSASPVKSPDGRRLGVIGAFEDISPQKRLESQLRFLANAGIALSESLGYEATLQQIAQFAVPCLADGCVIYLLEEDGEIIPAAVHCEDPEVQRATEEVLRRYPVRGAARGAGRVVRTGVPELVPEVSAEMWQEIARDPEHLELLRRTQLRSFLTVPLRARDVIIGALTLFDQGSGRRVGPHDVEVAEILGQRAGLAIDNARLYRAAQQATKARDDVLAVVAHDLRNPLSTILFSIDTIALTLAPDDASALRGVRLIQRSAKRIERLIADLLDAAQLETGTLALSKTSVDPAAIVTEAVELTRAIAPKHTLQVEVTGELPVIAADHHRILQVLSNLLGNAVKFTPPGGHIVVSAESRDGEVRVRVRDSGPGIPAEQLGHLFDRFWKATQTDRRGAGLGLAIAKGLVEAHGGKIWVESREGAGASFAFSLPIGS